LVLTLSASSFSRRGKPFFKKSFGNIVLCGFAKLGVFGF
jgi:hypothetical protein